MEHIINKGLQVLEKHGLFKKDHVEVVQFCESYILGKQHRVSFTMGTHKSKGILDYIHFDFWGPAQVKTHGGNSYKVKNYLESFCRVKMQFVTKHSFEFETL